MHTIEDTQTLQAQLDAWRAQGQTVALVPTMGNLHPGHLSLVTHARRQADRVVMTVFVNPLQFGPDEDFDRYPRTLDHDQTQARQAGVDLLWLPQQDALYPKNTAQTGRGLDASTATVTRVCADARVAADFEGADRPGHFDGVATIVAKLFLTVQPNIAVFGQKDLQQYAVIQTMVRDLGFPVQLVRAPIVREKDGLAMSSRNQYLSPADRQIAPMLYQTLVETAQCLQSTQNEAGEQPEQCITQAQAALAQAGLAVHYLAWVDLSHWQTKVAWTAKTGLKIAQSQPASQFVDDSQTEVGATHPLSVQNTALIVAAQLGSTRLLDNVIVTAP